MQDNFAFGAQFEKPIETPSPSPFFQRAGQTLMTKGEFVSPNYKKGEAGWSIDEFGNAEFNNGVFRGDVQLGTTARTVNEADEIQDAINDVSSEGGGTIYLAPGTYNMTESISIPSNVYLIGASRSAVIIDFGNAALSVQSIGTVGTHIINIFISNITIQNSTDSGLNFQYLDTSTIDGVDIFACNIGVEVDNCVAVGFIGSGLYCDGNGTGIKITNSEATSIHFTTSTNSTSGHGIEFSTVSNMTFFDSEISDNTGDGINLTSCTNIGFISLAVTGNGGQGIELVSGNNDFQFSHTVVDGNTSDGIKLTGTSDRNAIVATTVSNNGGYGINIAAATCDNNQIIAPAFDTNTSGDINDLGTNTSVTPPVGVVYTLQPNFLLANTSVVTVQANSNTTMYLGQFQLPFSITVNKISIDVVVVATGGTLDLTIYSGDGSRRPIAITTATISAAGVITTAVSSVVLAAGAYYFALNTNSTADISFKGFQCFDVTTLSGGVTSEPVLMGTLTITAGTPPATIDATAITSASTNLAVARFDN